MRLMTTYYVSSIVGAITTRAHPHRSSGEPAGRRNSGEARRHRSGHEWDLYGSPDYGDALDITTSGTASAPITFEAAPGQTPVIDSFGRLERD